MPFNGNRAQTAQTQGESFSGLPWEIPLFTLGVIFIVRNIRIMKAVEGMFSATWTVRPLDTDTNT
jgi:hypothetical protein